MTVYGLDVSSCQWPMTASVTKSVVARGTRFVIAKCGNGNDGSDPRWHAMLDLFGQAGVEALGLYHFMYLGLPPDVLHPGRALVDQVKAHFKACMGFGSAKGTIPTVWDLEFPAFQDWGKWHTSAAAIRAGIPDARKCHEDLYGVPPIIYTYPFFAKCIGFGAELAGTHLWAAEYSTLAPIPPWAGWSILQTAGGSAGTMSHRYKQASTLPNGMPVDTDIIVDEATFGRLLARGTPSTMPAPASAS